MNARVRPPFSDPGLLFEAIAEQLWALRVLAEIGERQATLGDLAGLNYSLRQITARTRLAVTSAGDLSELAHSQSQPLAHTEKAYTTSETAP